FARRRSAWCRARAREGGRTRCARGGATRREGRRTTGHGAGWRRGFSRGGRRGRRRAGLGVAAPSVNRFRFVAWAGQQELLPHLLSHCAPDSPWIVSRGSASRPAAFGRTQEWRVDRFVTGAGSEGGCCLVVQVVCAG